MRGFQLLTGSCACSPSIKQQQDSSHAQSSVCFCKISAWCVRLRSPAPALAGANNRLDVKDIFSFDRGSQTAMPMNLGESHCWPDLVSSLSHHIPVHARASELQSPCSSPAAPLHMVIPASPLHDSNTVHSPVF